MSRRAFLWACLAWLGAAAWASDAPKGVVNDAVFSQYTGYASSVELARRLVSPLNAQRLQQRAAASGVAIADQPVDLAHERFALYVPAQAPPDGYSLLVFVPPWNEAKVPPSWIPVLDRHGMILVSAANIGNDASVLDRRDPLSLLAATNVMARYRVNPRRVYVGGFSGGSRVALRLALGYPDLFHGALLDAGSDAIGQTLPLPPPSLFDRFQTESRIVYLTGQQDAARQDMERQSRQSLRDWCIDNVDVLSMAGVGHDLAEPAALDRALTSLETPHALDTAKLNACRARITSELNADIDKVQATQDAGRIDDAKKQLDAVDRHYGGLAAPRSVELAARLQPATH
nr:PHB depolymerase family esterase [Dyella sp. ASV24]